MSLSQKIYGLYSSLQSIFIRNVSVDMNRLPQHIAIIMDGNGRWAKSKGLPRKEGHKAGAEALRSIAAYCSEIGIKVLTVYAFSTENWKRPQDEVDALMELLRQYLEQADEFLNGKNNRIRVIGTPDGLSPNLLQQIRALEKRTANNTGMILNIALNYGGREELTHAARQIASDCVAGKISVESVDAQTLKEYLYTAPLPDPDLMIRPSGELRLSNFLLWQCAYSEFWFSHINWPDFTPKHLRLALHDYQQRSRRFGGV